MKLFVSGALLRWHKGRGSEIHDGYKFKDGDLYLYAANRRQWYRFRNVAQAFNKFGQAVDGLFVERGKIPEYYSEAITRG